MKLKRKIYILSTKKYVDLIKANNFSINKISKTQKMLLFSQFWSDVAVLTNSSFLIMPSRGVLNFNPIR